MSSESVDEDNLHISNAGSNGQVLTKQSGNAGGLTWADASGGLFASHAVIADVKSQGQHGGSFESGDWRLRDMQTEVFDPDNIVTGFQSNKFQLGAGTYVVEWKAPALMCEYHISRLYNWTDGQVYLGSSAYSYQDGATTESTGRVRFTIGGDKYFALYSRCNATQSGAYGLGAASSQAAEMYSQVYVWKEA